MKHKKVYASLPKDREIESVNLEEALKWLSDKEEKTGGRKKATKKKAASKKKSVKKKKE